MARNKTRVFLTMIVAVVALVACIGVAATAYAVPGDSANQTLLNDYLGSSLTTDLVGTTLAGPHTSYYFRVDLQAGETLHADFRSSTPTMNLQAIVFYGQYPGSVALSSTLARLTYTAPVTSPYTVYAVSSAPGTFTVEPLIRKSTGITGTSGTKTTRYDTLLALDGYLRSGTTSLDKTVYLFSSTNGKSWTHFSTAVTTATVSGAIRYRANVHRATKCYYRFRFEGDATHDSSWGPVITVYPKVLVSTPSTPSSVYRLKKFSVSSYLKPRHGVGTKPVRIYFYRWNGKTYAYSKYVLATASNYSTYSKVLAKTSLSTRGKYRVAVYHPADGANAATWSYSRYMVVK